MNKKRGQVTLYIIIGLILILLIMLLLYLLRVSILPEAEPEPLEKVPIELQPVKTFVEGCLKTTTADAIQIVAEHGGYADFTPLQSNPFKPTDVNSVEHTPNTNYLVPYWSYMRSRDTCVAGCEFASMAKPLCRQGSQCVANGRDSIEEEIDWYINVSLEECLNEFAVLEQQGMHITMLDDKTIRIRPKTVVQNQSVIVFVDMPLRIEYQDSIKHLNTFTVTIPSSLAELYRVALEITNYESQNCFIEDHELNVMAFYQGLDRDDLPPYYAETVGNPIKSFWILQGVEQKLKSITAFAMQQIRVFNTSVFPFATVPPTDMYSGTKQAMYNQFVFYPLQKFHDVQVNFFYFPWWNPYLKIDPSRGSIIGPSNIISGSGGGLWSSIVGRLSPTTYEFFYHYSFPLVVEIRKWNEREFKYDIFRFALESNIRGNKCFSSGATLLTQPGFEQSLLCDDDFRGRTEQTIWVKDETTNAGIRDVEVYFYAGESCYLGKTDSAGKLKTALPLAVGGFLDFRKDGYLEHFTHEQDFPSLADVKLKPIFQKKVDIRIFNETNFLLMATMAQPAALSFRDSVVYEPGDSHLMVVTLSRVKDSYHDGILESTVAVEYEDGEVKVTPETLDLAPGKYEAEIMLIHNQQFTVVEEKDRTCAGGGGCEKKPKDQCKTSLNWLSDCDDCDWKDGSACTEKCWEETDCYKWGFYCDDCDVDEEIVYEAIELDQIPNGGVLFNEDNGYWQITGYDELKDETKPNVKFYIVQQKLPIRHNMLTELDAYKTYSKEFKFVFMPEFE